MHRRKKKKIEKEEAERTGVEVLVSVVCVVNEAKHVQFLIGN